MAGITVQELGKAKRFRVYKNGDSNFSGKDFILNRRRIRTWDALLQAVTTDLKCPEAIRSIRTPTGGTRIESFDALESNSNYVAVGHGKFRKVGYEKIGELAFARKTAATPRNLEVKPVEHSRIQVSGRIRKIPTDVLTIFVYANGNDLKPPCRVTLTRKMMTKWELILNQITDKVTLMSGAARKLCTLDGQVVTDPTHLKSMEYYVAVGTEVGGFKKLDYGARKPAFNSSPKRERKKLTPLPPIRGTPRKNTKGSSQVGSQSSDQTGQLESSLGSTGSSNKSRASRIERPSRAGSKPRQPPNNKAKPQPGKKKEVKEEDSVFHAKPVTHKRSSDKPREVDLDKDEGGVFKAKGDSVATKDAAEVEDTADTKVDLPIDQVEAEEVKEELESSSKDEVKNTNNSNVESLSKKHSLQNRTPTPWKSPSPQQSPRASPDVAEGQNSPDRAASHDQQMPDRSSSHVNKPLDRPASHGQMTPENLGSPKQMTPERPVSRDENTPTRAQSRDQKTPSRPQSRDQKTPSRPLSRDQKTPSRPLSRDQTPTDRPLSKEHNTPDHADRSGSVKDHSVSSEMKSEDRPGSKPSSEIRENQPPEGTGQDQQGDENKQEIK